MQLPDIRHPSGVYRITNTANGKFYIGSSIRLKTRIRQHTLQLQRVEHINGHMQASWLKHGADKFRVDILLYAAPQDLIFFEQRAIDSLSPEFNLCRIAGSTLGTRRTDESRRKMSEKAAARATTEAFAEFQRKSAKSRTGVPRGPFSDEHLANMSKARKGVPRGPFSDEHRANLSKSQVGNKKWLGRRHTEETKAKISQASRRKGRFTEDQIRDIRERCANGESHGRIAENLGVTRETVTAIHNRKVYAWVT